MKKISKFNKIFIEGVVVVRGRKYKYISKVSSKYKKILESGKNYMRKVKIYEMDFVMNSRLFLRFESQFQFVFLAINAAVKIPILSMLFNFFPYIYFCVFL